MPYLTVNGLQTYCQMEGSGPTVVLIHGLGSCADDWLLQTPVLAASFAVLTLDLRGHGRSGKPPGPYTVAQMGDDVAALMDTLDTGPAHVVGLSLGGLVAQALAAEHPELVRSLVLVNTFARLRPEGLRGWLLFARRGLSLLGGGIEKQAQVIATSMFPRPDQDEIRQLVIERLSSNDPRAYRAAMWAALRFDGRRLAARIRVPTLVIAGDQDTTVSMTAKRELAAGIDGARLEIVAGSGHVTPIDDADEFNRLLVEFLMEIDN